jgi:hypothetical protein
MKKYIMAGNTMIDDFWVNDILWQFSVLVYNISLKMCLKKSKFKQKKRRSIIEKSQT